MTALNIIFVIIAAFILIAWILPKIVDLLDGLIADSRAIPGIMGLLMVVVGVLVLQKIVELIKGIENQYTSYIGVLDGGLNVLLGFLPYIQWILVAVLLGLFIGSGKKK